MDVVSNLSSFSFGSGLNEDEKKLIYLRARSAGLTFCGCAHAVYLCHHVHSLRCVIKRRTADSHPLATAGDSDLCVGILGMGHMGKQLLLSILEMTPIQPSQIKVSTRRPESVELVETGVECFFDNRRLAAWADVLFLCCLPSHLPKVCADLRSRLSKHCLVYSFISAVAVTRLTELLGHDFIVKPQYSFVACDTADVWLSCSHWTTALRDPLMIKASCPVTLSGKDVSLLQTSNLIFETWGLLYSLLNICTSASVGSSDALSLINIHLVHLNNTNICARFDLVLLVLKDFKKLPFPWISLTDAQTKETPLLRFLSSNKSTQQCISAAYESLLETPAKKH
uniref:NADP-dependent oxidoreductase domain-containing protein 1 n=1 Tax=Anabas testudineus TaxID=64144 RepID=A0A3Q1H0W9_ANATE